MKRRVGPEPRRRRFLERKRLTGAPCLASAVAQPVDVASVRLKLTDGVRVPSLGEEADEV